MEQTVIKAMAVLLIVGSPQRVKLLFSFNEEVLFSHID